MPRRHKFLLVYLVLVLLALGMAARGPVAFQKSNAIHRTQELPALPPGEVFDVANALGSLPNRPKPVRAVLPEEKYRQTVLEGGGYCSEKSFGIAWSLDQQSRSFQVVHLFPPDSFLHGVGHTLLRTHLAWQGRESVGLVDMPHGAIPLSGNRLIDVADLMAGPIPDFRFAAFGVQGQDATVFYGERLESTVIGVITGREIARYFRFIEGVYLPLGNERLEKLVYDGLAILLGFYPTIEVIDTDRLFAGRQLLRAGNKAGLWLLRSALIVLPGFLVLELWTRGARR